MTDTQGAQLTEEQIEDIEDVVESEDQVDEIISNIEIDNSVEDLDLRQRNPRNFGLTEHLGATASSVVQSVIGFIGYFGPDRVYPSHAVVEDIEYQNDTLTLDMKCIGHDNEFSAEYELPSDSETPVPEKTVTLFNMADADIYQPSTILGKKVPINYAGGYAIDYPPSEPGIVKWAQRKFRRAGRNHNLTKVKNGLNRPNRKAWSLFSIPVVLFWSTYLLGHLSLSFSAIFFSVLYTVFHGVLYAKNLSD